MCTFTELIQRETKIKTIREGKRKWKREGIEEGKREGIEESHLKFYSNLKKAKLDDNTICSYMGITIQKLMELKEMLSVSENLEPKTV